jgi:hypothetical protein
MVLASAVRNAVISSAFKSARGAPLLSKSVKLPFGVVDCALDSDCGASCVVVEDVEDLWDMESEESEDAIDALEEEVFDLLSSASANVTILTPMPSLLELYQLMISIHVHGSYLLAGISSVVWPSPRLRDVRSGWYDDEHPLLESSSVAVE